MWVLANNNKMFIVIRDAIEKGDLAKVKRLIERGVDVNESNYWGDTLLMIAVQENKFEIVIWDENQKYLDSNAKENIIFNLNFDFRN